MLRSSATNPEQLLVFQFGQEQISAAFEQVRGELPLRFDHLVDLFLDRSPAHELMYQHVLVLSNAKCAVGGLIFHRGVPPAVEVHHVRCGGEVEARTSRL